jgi:hypothetical protein
MRIIFKRISQLAVVAVLFACTKAPEDRLVGEWKGTESTGETWSLVFNRDRTFRMVHGNLVFDGPTLGGKVEWRTDASHDPIALDVVLTRTDGQQLILPMIIRFIADQKMQLRTSPDTLPPRPTSFSVEDTENQLVLVKQ